MEKNQPVYFVLSRRQLQEMMKKLDATEELFGSPLPSSPRDCCQFTGTVDTTGLYNSDSGEWQVQVN